MDHTFPPNGAHDDPSPAFAPDRGCIESVESLRNDLRGLAYQLQLASLSARKAGGGLVPFVLYGAVVGALVIIAWFGVAVAMAFWLIPN